MLTLIVLKFRLGRGKGILRQLGADVADQVDLGMDERNPEKNPGENERPFPHSNTHNLMMNEALESCKWGAQAATLYRLSASARRSIISWKVAISTFGIKRLCTKPSTTDLEGLNSLS